MRIDIDKQIRKGITSSAIASDNIQQAIDDAIIEIRAKAEPGWIFAGFGVMIGYEEIGMYGDPFLIITAHFGIIKELD